MEAKRPAQPGNGRPQKSEGQVIAEAQRRAGIMAYGGENSGGVGGAVAAATGLPMGGGTGAQGAQLIGASADGDGQGGSRRTNLENLRQTSQIDRVGPRHWQPRYADPRRVRSFRACCKRRWIPVSPDMSAASFPATFIRTTAASSCWKRERASWANIKPASSAGNIVSLRYGTARLRLAAWRST
jgi:hypothetical protein